MCYTKGESICIENCNDASVLTAESWFVYFAQCHYPTKKDDLYADENEWEKFVLDLVR